MLLSTLLVGCQPNEKAQLTASVEGDGEDKGKGTVNKDLINASGMTVASRFMLPDGFERTSVATGSFAAYLRDLPLKPHGAKVHYYNGGVKENYGVYDAVIDIDVGKGDLQQCADAVMRLRAEYLYHSEQEDDIHFNFTNGFRVDYNKWKQGNRIVVKGNKSYWAASASPSNEYKSFRRYMDVIFSYAGTLSLSKELDQVALDEMQIGDVFIQGGSPGHAVIVVDMAVNKENGKKLFLLAQSYMPAQEIQILKNPSNESTSPWYTSDFGQTLHTPEWTFEYDQLMRFPE